jgi:hypothetical protein
VQAQGKKAMPAADWARGVRLSSDARFDVPEVAPVVAGSGGEARA